jgi:myb proto-oncogene protein
MGREFGPQWTVEEDAKLTEAVEELGKDWVRVAAMVLVRTNQQRRYRWVMNLDPNVTLGKWTVEEDAKLTDAVKEHGVNNWVAVGALVPGRTKRQCGYRWAKLKEQGGKSLHPDTNTGELTLEVAVAALVPGR